MNEAQFEAADIALVSATMDLIFLTNTLLLDIQFGEGDDAWEDEDFDEAEDSTQCRNQ